MSTIPADSSGHDHAHGHDHPAHLAHHFESSSQQFEAGKLGMWLFLATEVLFFGGLFVWYAILRSTQPEMFLYASAYLDTLMGGLNTCVLILSSLTMALAVRFAQTNRRGPLIICLWLTLAGAAGFMVIKYFEYTHKIHEHLVWGPTFYEPVEHGHGDHAHAAGAGHEDAHTDETAVAAHVDEQVADTATALASLPPGVEMPAVEASAIAPPALGPAGIKSPGEMVHHGEHFDLKVDKSPHLQDADLPPNTHQFFGVYYAMTGLHGIHVVVGMGIILWLIVRSMKGHFNSEYFTPVDLGGLYWHIVDLIWIFLFPLFYIIH